jgi:hypothetical protein
MRDFGLPRKIVKVNRYLFAAKRLARRSLGTNEFGFDGQRSWIGRPGGCVQQLARLASMTRAEKGDQAQWRIALLQDPAVYGEV